eukprot:gene413-767_t
MSFDQSENKRPMRDNPSRFKQLPVEVNAEIVQALSDNDNHCDSLRNLLQTAKDYGIPEKYVRCELGKCMDNLPSDITSRGNPEFAKNLILNLKKCPEVTSINFTNCNMLDDDLAQLSELVNLTTINLTNCRGISDDGLRKLSALKELRSINLTKCYAISDDGLQHLSALTKLRSIDLTSCSRITDTGLYSLRTLEELRAINLESCFYVTNTGIRYLSEFNTNLTTLVLPKAIDDDGLVSLSVLRELEMLDLTQCEDITETGLQQLRKGRERLSISNPNMKVRYPPQIMALFNEGFRRSF